jgi:hypothetical protein
MGLVNLLKGFVIGATTTALSIGIPISAYYAGKETERQEIKKEIEQQQYKIYIEMNRFRLQFCNYNHHRED